MKRWLFVVCLLLVTSAAFARPQWTPEQANEWFGKMPWLVGCNFGPSTAINQLEMWQAETFDRATIDRELALAEGLGFNSLRVFLHDLLWKQDPEGFTKRIDQFLEAADKHHIGVMFVLFDSVWDPNPKLGKQREPKPGVHNSGWVQSPGAAALQDPAQWPRLEEYVKGIVGRYRSDKRIHAWDIVNEPDNPNTSSYGPLEPPDKAELGFALLRKAYGWAREANPSQPITAAPWRDDWSSLDAMAPLNRFMITESDIVSFHGYAKPDEMKQRVEWLKQYGRPILCTEYMARPAGSTFDPILGYLKSRKVGAYNWGFVAGKTQTNYPWDSWKKPYETEPAVWFHEIFRKDGTPYIEKEVEYIRSVTGKK